VSHGTGYLETLATPNINIHGLDIEQRATFGFLARYHGQTLEAYEHDLRQFYNWCRQVGLKHMLAADRTYLQLYVRQLQERGLAEATVARRVGTVRLLLKYAHIDGLISKDPSAFLEVPKVDYRKQRRTFYTTLDFAKILKEAMKTPRDHAVITLMGFVGLRVNEAMSLDIANLQRAIGQVRIEFIGKGGNLYKINLPFAVVQAIDTYLDGRTEGPVFLNEWGNRMTREQVQATLDRLNRICGIEYRVTPHGLRRTLARTLQERGVELGAIQQTLRHADPRVTVTCYIGDGGGVADVARQTVTAIYSSMVA
jgi:integrase/recombinase XerD